MNDAESAQPGEAKPPGKTGRKLFFLLSVKPGETFEQFRERVIATAYETGFLKKKPDETSSGVTGLPRRGFLLVSLVI